MTDNPDFEASAHLNIYSKIILREAAKRGIGIRIDDERKNIFTLSHNGVSISCNESLSDKASAMAMVRTSDKELTLSILAKGGLKVPDQQAAGEDTDNKAFLDRHRAIVVKPAVGEQGRGISVDVRDVQTMDKAIKAANLYHSRVLLEQMVPGHDVRIIVINGEVIACATRQPPVVTGDGKSTVGDLIEAKSTANRKVMNGLGTIPLDPELYRTLQHAGYTLDDILADGEELKVRKAANLHTGGTIIDVTDTIHPALKEAAVKGAELLDIPVTGFDFMVPDIEGPDYVIIEANERPGLANHDPHPTAERFVDFLFPETKGQ